jgi:putative transposase
LWDGEAAYSMRWKEIKSLFTKGHPANIGTGETRNASPIKRNEAAVWQRRFWEHMIRDQGNLHRHGRKYQKINIV